MWCPWQLWPRPSPAAPSARAARNGSGVWARAQGGKAEERQRARPVGYSWASRGAGEGCGEWENRANRAGAPALSRTQLVRAEEPPGSGSPRCFVLGAGQGCRRGSGKQGSPSREGEWDIQGDPDPEQQPECLPGAVGPLSGSPGRLAGCARRLCSAAGADSQRGAVTAKSGQPGPRGTDALWGQQCRQIFQLRRQTALPSACWGCDLCQPCLPLLLPLASAASRGCQLGMGQTAEPAARWGRG